MEDVKWSLKKWWSSDFTLMLLIFVIAGVVCWGELHTEEQKVAEEVWEPPVEIKDSETKQKKKEYGNFHRFSILVYSASQ